MAITHPKIGTLEFLKLTGPVNPSAEVVEPVRRFRVDGIAFRKTGKTTKPFSVVTLVDVNDKDNVDDRIVAYKALVSTLVSVRDEMGKTHTNIMVLSVEPRQHYAVENMIGGTESTPEAMLECVWTMQATEVG